MRIAEHLVIIVLSIASPRELIFLTSFPIRNRAVARIWLAALPPCRLDVTAADYGKIEASS
jgi:hypothetical protein